VSTSLSTMWPFSIFRRRKYERECKAAVLVFLGTYLYERLTAVEKAQVESEVADMLTGINIEGRTGYASSWETAGAYRAMAMAHLGIGLFAGLSWPDLLRPWKDRPSLLELPEADTRIANFLWDYHPIGQATDDAKAFLRASGLEIPEIGPWSLPRIEGGEPLGPGEHPPWRK
jgi:hypothetical protein